MLLRPLNYAEPSEPSPLVRHSLVRGVVDDAREDLIDTTESLGDPVDARGRVHCDRFVQEETHGDAEEASGKSMRPFTPSEVGVCLRAPPARSSTSECLNRGGCDKRLREGDASSTLCPSRAPCDRVCLRVW